MPLRRGFFGAKRGARARDRAREHVRRGGETLNELRGPPEGRSTECQQADRLAANDEWKLEPSGTPQIRSVSFGSSVRRA